MLEKLKASNEEIAEVTALDLEELASGHDPKKLAAPSDGEPLVYKSTSELDYSWISELC